jgi:hypothetical protein
MNGRKIITASNFPYREPLLPLAMTRLEVPQF